MNTRLYFYVSTMSQYPSLCAQFGCFDVPYIFCSSNEFVCFILYFHWSSLDTEKSKHLLVFFVSILYFHWSLRNEHKRERLLGKLIIYSSEAVKFKVVRNKKN